MKFIKRLLKNFESKNKAAGAKVAPAALFFIKTHYFLCTMRGIEAKS